MDAKNNFTVSLWLKPDALGTRTILYKQHSAAPWESWEIALDTGRIFFQIANTASGYFSVTMNESITAGHWYHIAGINSGGTMSLYVNGVLENDIVVGPVTGTIRDGNGALIFADNGSGTGYMDGIIDDVRLYDRALTAADIQALYDSWPGHVRYNINHLNAEYHDGYQWIAMGKAGAPADGLVGHWKLDEASGTLADSSGNGNTGTQSGGIGYASAGVVGTAVNFDGTDDYIDAGSGTSIANISDAITVSAWVRPPNGVSQAIVSNSRDCCGTYNGFQLGRDSSNRFAFTVWNSTDTLTLSPAFPSSGGWYHVTGTFDGSNVRIFVNGTLEATTSYAGKIGVPASSSLKIGRIGAVSAWHFNGNIDDVRIYNHALSAAEVAGLYRQGLRDDGLIAHWKLDESGGTVANDSVGSNIGFASGGVVFGSAGKVGLAAQFDGVNDYIDAGDFTAEKATNFSYSTWVNLLGIADLAGDARPIAGIGRNSDMFHNSLLTIGDWAGANDERIKLAWYDGSWHDYYSVSEVPLTGWHHIAVTYDGAKVRFYLNGTLNDDTDNLTTNLPVGGGMKFRIGTREGAIGSSAYAFAGMLDDIRYYNRVLSANEIAEIYTNGQAGHISRYCANPDRAEGTIIFNTTHNVMQFCNGAEWVAMGPSPGAGGGGCGSPARAKGAMIYNADKSVMQYCDGTKWVRIGGTGAVAPSAGLAAYWKLDETSGGSIADSAGSSTGTWTDNTGNSVAEETAAGKVATALTFDGTNDFINTNYAPVLGTAADFTIAFWFKRSTATLGGDKYLFGSVADTGVFDEKISFSIDGDGSTCTDESIFIQVADTDSGGADQLCSNVVNNTSWHQLAFTYDVDGYMRVYIDGVQSSSLAVTSSSNGVKDFTGYPFYLGTRNFGSGPWFNGILDDARIYNRSLSGDEVRDLYYATGGQ